MSTVEIAVPVAPAVADDDVAETLERAADLLRIHGWTTGVTFCASTGAMCARGAILQASVNQRQTLHEEAEDRLARYLHIDSVVAWNDSMNMTAEDVIRALNEAAAHGG